MTPYTLLSRPDHRALLHAMPKVVALAALITLGAKIQVPFWPAPMTMHTLAVLSIAILAGPRLAAGAVATYLAAGAVGLPVFSGSPARGIGLAYMVGPTGGYLLGYLLAAALTGWLAIGGGTMRRILAMLAGMGVIYANGAAWLCRFVPAADVWAVGIFPFLMGDLLKIGLAAGLATLWTRGRA